MGGGGGGGGISQAAYIQPNMHADKVLALEKGLGETRECCVFEKVERWNEWHSLRNAGILVMSKISLWLKGIIWESQPS